MRLTIKVERGVDGRWIAVAHELAWVVGYGVTQEAAICRAEQSAIEEVAERVAAGELTDSAFDLSFTVVRPANSLMNWPVLSLFSRQQ